MKGGCLILARIVRAPVVNRSALDPVPALVELPLLLLLYIRNSRRTLDIEECSLGV